MTFCSRSILASPESVEDAPAVEVLASLIRFTIHFSPSGGERFKRVDRSLRMQINKCDREKMRILTRYLSFGECDNRLR